MSETTVTQAAAASRQQSACSQPRASAFEAEHLSRAVVGKVLVDGVSVQVRTGEVMAVVGPSGAGKSSFLRLLNRLDEPTGGTVRLYGRDYRELEPRDLRRRVGMVMRSPKTIETPKAGEQRVAVPLANLLHFGMMVGSPPGVPGGGMTGMTPPPVGGTEMLGSTSAGGQITPLERDNSSLKLALPVVSPGLGTTKPPVLAWQPKFGVDEIAGGAVRSDCADALVTAAKIVTPTMIHGRMTTSDVVI